MASIKLTTPPKIKKKNIKYEDFRQWLEENFHSNVCAYCFLRSSEKIEIDHYEPKDYRPRKQNDPNNLLTACRNCNGRGGKSDFHPLYKKRTRRPKDKVNFFVHDIRNENVADLYQVDKNGEILPIGKQLERAIYIYCLLNLDVESRRDRREKLLDMANTATQLILDPVTLKQSPYLNNHLNNLIDEVTRSELFFYLLDIKIHPMLHIEVKKRRKCKSIV